MSSKTPHTNDGSVPSTTPPVDKWFDSYHRQGFVSRFLHVAQYMFGALQEHLEVVLMGGQVNGRVADVAGTDGSVTYFHNNSSAVIANTAVVVPGRLCTSARKSIHGGQHYTVMIYTCKVPLGDVVDLKSWGCLATCRMLKTKSIGVLLYI